MVPVEYVSYIDDSQLSFSPFADSVSAEYYPDELVLPYAPPSDGEMHIENGVYLVYDMNRRVVAGGLSKSIYALRCISYNGSDVASAETAYYYLDVHAFGSYSFSIVPDSMLDIINSGDNPLVDPFVDYDPSGTLGYSQDSIFSWLYNLGATMLDNDLVSSLLSFEIGGHNLISLLIQGGFMIYVSWVVTKWVIP